MLALLEVLNLEMRILSSFSAAHHNGKDIDLHDLFSFYKRFWTERPKLQPGQNQPQPAQPAAPEPECEEGCQEEGGEEEPLEDDGYVDDDDAVDGLEDRELGERLGLLVPARPVTKPPKAAMEVARAERLARIQQLKTLDTISRTVLLRVSHLGLYYRSAELRNNSLKFYKILLPRMDIAARRAALAAAAPGGADAPAGAWFRLLASGFVVWVGLFYAWFI